MTNKRAISIFCLITLSSSLSHSAISEHDMHLLQAAEDNNIIQATQSLQLGANPNAQQHSNSLTPLMHAATNDSSEMMRLLFSYHANPNHATTSGWTPVLLAAHHGRARALQTLANYKANLKFTHPYNALNAITLAAIRGHIEAVQILQNAGVTVPSDEEIRGNHLLDSAQKEMAIQTINGIHESLEPFPITL